MPVVAILSWPQRILAGIALVAVGELVLRVIASMRQKRAATIYRFDASTPTSLGGSDAADAHDAAPTNILLDPDLPPAIADGRGDRRIICPCCGYPTARDLTASGACVFCEWSDPAGDGVPLEAARARYEAALAVAKDNLAQYGSAIAPHDRAAHGMAPSSPDEARLRQELRARYDNVLAGDAPDAFAAWERIDSLVGQLQAAAQQRMDNETPDA